MVLFWSSCSVLPQKKEKEKSVCNSTFSSSPKKRVCVQLIIIIIIIISCTLMHWLSLCFSLYALTTIISLFVFPILLPVVWSSQFRKCLLLCHLLKLQIQRGKFLCLTVVYQQCRELHLASTIRTRFAALLCGSLLAASNSKLQQPQKSPTKRTVPCNTHFPNK